MTNALTKIINETLASGVEPLHRKYLGIYDGYGDIPNAFFTKTEVFTSASGIINYYESAIENNETGKRFSLSCIRHAISTSETLRSADRRFSFITAKATKSFLEGEVEKELSPLLNEDTKPETICLVFDEASLIQGGEQLINGIEEARSLGFTAAINGFNGDQSLQYLMKVPVDYAFLSPEITALMRDRNKPDVFTSIISLLKSLRISPILCGVNDDETIRTATAAECFGIMPSDIYQGQFAFPKQAMELKEILTSGDDVL